VGDSDRVSKWTTSSWMRVKKEDEEKDEKRRDEVGAQSECSAQWTTLPFVISGGIHLFLLYTGVRAPWRIAWQRNHNVQSCAIRAA
jgi:hypothetical protein